MKSVAVFFDAPGFESYPFDTEEYRTAYHEVGALIQERGGRFFIARGQDTFQGRNMFSGGWEYRDTRFVECGPFTVNLIYDKGYFRTDGASDVLNDRELDTICTDKSKTIALFPELSPKTFTVNDASELRDALSRMNDARVVAKPLDGEEGKGVMIASASEIAAAVTSFPYLIQEFIDTSGGIPGVVEGIHDFRIITIAGDPVLSYVRTPPPGKLTAKAAVKSTSRLRRFPKAPCVFFAGSTSCSPVSRSACTAWTWVCIATGRGRSSS